MRFAYATTAACEHAQCDWQRDPFVKQVGRAIPKSEIAPQAQSPVYLDRGPVIAAAIDEMVGKTVLIHWVSSLARYADAVKSPVPRLAIGNQVFGHGVQDQVRIAAQGKPFNNPALMRADRFHAQRKLGGDISIAQAARQ